MIRWKPNKVPSCICVEPDDSIILSARENLLELRDGEGTELDTINVLDASLTTGNSLGLEALDICSIAAHGEQILLADAVHHCCLRLAPSEEGTLVATVLHDPILGFGAHSSDQGSFRIPAGVAFAESMTQLLCCDSGNDRINVFDAESGAFLESFGNGGDGTGNLSKPQCVAIDESRQELYVADTGNHQIKIFNMETFEFIRQFGQQGNEEGDLLQPLSLCVIPPSNTSIPSTQEENEMNTSLVAVADTGNHRIQIFSSSGIPLWMCDAIASGVSHSPDSTQSEIQTKFSRPFSISLASDGDLLVADTNCAVWITPPSGLFEEARNSERFVQQHGVQKAFEMIVRKSNQKDTTVENQEETNYKSQQNYEKETQEGINSNSQQNFKKETQEEANSNSQQNYKKETQEANDHLNDEADDHSIHFDRIDNKSSRMSGNDSGRNIIETQITPSQTDLSDYTTNEKDFYQSGQQELGHDDLDNKGLNNRGSDQAVNNTRNQDLSANRDKDQAARRELDQTANRNQQQTQRHDTDTDTQLLVEDDSLSIPLQQIENEVEDLNRSNDMHEFGDTSDESISRNDDSLSIQDTSLTFQNQYDTLDTNKEKDTTQGNNEENNTTQGNNEENNTTQGNNKENTTTQGKKKHDQTSIDDSLSIYSNDNHTETATLAQAKPQLQLDSDSNSENDDGMTNDAFAGYDDVLNSVRMQLRQFDKQAKAVSSKKTTPHKDTTSHMDIDAATTTDKNDHPPQGRSRNDKYSQQSQSTSRYDRYDHLSQGTSVNDIGDETYDHRSKRASINGRMDEIDHSSERDIHEEVSRDHLENEKFIPNDPNIPTNQIQDYNSNRKNVPKRPHALQSGTYTSMNVHDDDSLYNSQYLAKETSEINAKCREILLQEGMLDTNEHTIHSISPMMQSNEPSMHHYKQLNEPKVDASKLRRQVHPYYMKHSNASNRKPPNHSQVKRSNSHKQANQNQVKRSNSSNRPRRNKPTSRSQAKKATMLASSRSSFFDTAALEQERLHLEQERLNLARSLQSLKKQTSSSIEKAKSLRETLIPQSKLLAQQGHKIPSIASITHMAKQIEKSSTSTKQLNDTPNHHRHLAHSTADALQQSFAKAVNAQSIQEAQNELSYALELLKVKFGFTHSDVAPVPDYSKVTKISWLEERCLELRLRILALQRETPQWSSALRHFEAVQKALNTRKHRYKANVGQFQAAIDAANPTVTQQELEKALEERQDLQQQLSTLQTQLQALNNSDMTNNKTFESLMHKHFSHSKQKDELIQAQTTEFRAAAGELADLREALHDKKHTLKHAEHRFETQLAELKNLRAQRDRLLRQLE